MTNKKLTDRHSILRVPYRAGLAVALAAFLAAGLAGISHADSVPTNNVVNMVPPGLVNYQGTLLTPTNTPYIDGLYDIQFRLYSQSSDQANQAIWGAGFKCNVKNGVFGVMLGSATGQSLTNLPPTYGPTELWKALWFDEGNAMKNNAPFLGITVLQDQNHNKLPVPSEAVPRQQLLTTPFAYRAQQAEYARRASADFDVAGNLNATNGRVTAGSFTGSGTNLTGVAKLSGGNTFSGLQTVNGTVAATTFTGDGTSLSGVPKLSGGNTYYGDQEIKNALTVDGFGWMKNSLQVENQIFVNGDVNAHGNIFAFDANAFRPVVVGEAENLRIVRGTVNGSAGTVSAGTGFSVAKTNSIIGTGKPGFYIDFDTAFSDTPTVTATLLNPDNDPAWYGAALTCHPTSGGVYIITHDSASGLPYHDFSFIAIGSR